MEWGGMAMEWWVELAAQLLLSTAGGSTAAGCPDLPVATSRGGASCPCWPGRGTRRGCGLYAVSTA